MAFTNLGAKFNFEDNNVTERVGKLINVISGLSDKVEGFENVIAGTSKEMNVLSGSINQVGTALTGLYNQKIKKSASDTVEALNNTQKSIDKLGAQANRFVSSNIMAQFQDVFVSAQMGMRPLTIALQQGTQLMAAFAQSKAPLKDLVAGFKALISPASFLTVIIVGLVAKFIQLVDCTKLFKNIINGLAGNGKISKWFRDLADSSDAAWASIKKLLDLSKDFTEEMDDLAEKKFVLETKLFNPDNLNEKEMNEYLYTWSKYGELLKKADKEKQKFLDSLDAEKLSQSEIDERFASYMKEYEQTRSEAWGQAQEWAKEKIEVDRLQKMLDDREKESSKISKSVTKELEKQENHWAEIVKNAEQSISSLKLEGSLLGKSDITQNYEKTLQSLIQQAEDRDIDLYGDDKKIDKLKELAEGYAEITVEVDNLTEAYNDGKSIFKGFFTDMVDGLKKGESAWESFGNAVLNVLNKIQEKLMDKTTDLLFDALWNVGSAYFGSTTTGSTDFGSAEFAQSVGRKPVMAADGGVFSNGVYNSPTLFKFARGGRFGVMGEAGPEAVMPLTRGPDGSLGVKAESVGSSPVIVNIINNSNAQARTEQRQTSQGVELDVMIDNLVADKMSKNGSASNTALKAISSQSLVMR